MITNIDAHVHEQIKQQKLLLEQKTNKTQEDLQHLQAYTFLIDHPDQATGIFEQVKTGILEGLDSDKVRYMGIGSLVRNSLIGSFADQ